MAAANEGTGTDDLTSLVTLVMGAELQSFPLRLAIR